MSDNLFILSCSCGKEPKMETDNMGVMHRIACTCGLISSPWSFAISDAIRLWNKFVMVCFEGESDAEDRWLTKKFPCKTGVLPTITDIACSM